MLLKDTRKTIFGYLRCARSLPRRRLSFQISITMTPDMRHAGAFTFVYASARAISMAAKYQLALPSIFIHAADGRDAPAPERRRDAQPARCRRRLHAFIFLFGRPRR